MRDFIQPDWPAPPTVRALSTTRHGGLSLPPYASLNLGDHVGDDAAAVAANRERLQSLAALPARPLWLNQVHGTVCVDADHYHPGCQADAIAARTHGQVCAIMTADCLPLLFCNRRGSRIAAAHAGWRGLLDGVIEATLAALDCPGADLLVWLGPAIGPQAFEVGGEVRDAFIARNPEAAVAFTLVRGAQGKWLGNLYLLARQRLAQTGVTAVYGGDRCTWQEGDTFFSYRRDGATGRMASLIWLTSPEAGA